MTTDERQRHTDEQRRLHDIREENMERFAELLLPDPKPDPLPRASQTPTFPAPQ